MNFFAALSFGLRTNVDGLLLVIRLHAHAEGQVAVVELLLLLEVRGGERLLVRLGDDGRLVVLVGLPEDDADLVVGEVLAPEDLHVLVGIALRPSRRGNAPRSSAGARR